MSFRYLDMEHYERIEHFRYFLSMPYPYAGVTVDIDVTDIVSFCKARGYSFYLTFLHAAAKAADRVPELRRRIHDGVIIEYDTCPTSHTELCADGTYCYCTLHHDKPFAEYTSPMPRPSAVAAVWTARCVRTRTWRACILSPRSRGCITARSSSPWRAARNPTRVSPGARLRQTPRAACKCR